MNANPEVSNTSTRKKEDFSAGLIRELVNYDPETGIFTNKINRGNLAPKGSICGTPNQSGYLVLRVFTTKLLAHRVAWLYMTGSWPMGPLDHINGMRDDNRFANLREATPSQNAWNSKRSSTNKSGFKGITWCAAKGKWRARVTLNGKHFQVGRFHKLEDAAEAVKAVREKLHREFANHG